jgi:polyadenylate-binding protein
LPDEDEFTNVYIKNLPPSISTDDDLRELFAPYGNITSAKLQVRQGPDGSGLYFGFCNFESHAEAVAAIKGLNGQTIEGKIVECVRFKTRDERLRELQSQTEKWRQANYERFKDRNLYVRNFDENFTEEALREFFQEFGEIESVKIDRDENGQSRKFGYVCFKNVADAQKCIAASPLLKFPETGKQVYVAEMIPRAKKRQLNLQNKSQQGHPGVEGRAAPPAVVPGLPPFVGAPREVQGFAAVQPGGFPRISPFMSPAIPAGIAPPGAYAPLGGDGLAAPGFVAPSNPKERVRQEIMDNTAGNQQLQNQLLTRLKELSEDQALRLTRDQALLIQWMRPQ